MGQFFRIVNAKKRQYVDPEKFGENQKYSTLLQGKHGLAVAYLISSGLVSDNSLIGSWAGDPIVAAGEYADPDLHGIKTASRSDRRRNLYQLAEQKFEDISHKAIAMLCEFRESLIDQFVFWAKCNPDLCVELMLVVSRVGCKPLERELLKEFGNNVKALKDHLRKATNYRQHKAHVNTIRLVHNERRL
jgi:hypothetical protein